MTISKSATTSACQSVRGLGDGMKGVPDVNVTSLALPGSRGKPMHCRVATAQQSHLSGAAIVPWGATVPCAVLVSGGCRHLQVVAATGSNRTRLSVSQARSWRASAQLLGRAHPCFGEASFHRPTTIQGQQVVHRSTLHVTKSSSSNAFHNLEATNRTSYHPAMHRRQETIWCTNTGPRM